MMRSAIAALLIAGCSPAEPVVATSPLDVKPVPTASAAPVAVAAPVEPTVFTKRELVVGDKREENEDLSFSLSFVVMVSGSSQNTDVSETERTTKSIELLAVKAGTPTKVRVTYRSARKADKPKVTEGKTYVVEAKNGAIDVRDPKGVAVSSEEQRLVSKDWKSLGKPDPLVAGIPTTPLRPGDRVDSMSKALADYMNRDADSGLQASNVAISFRGRTGEEGLFDVAATLGKRDGSMTFRVTLTGQMRVRVNGGQMVGMSLTGPIAFTSPDPQGTVNVEGHGTMTVSLTSTP